MPTLSLTMIMKNEEATIERVLACAKTFCDEMIVVDTGSTDRSVEIAESMGAKVLHFEWIHDFAAARNFSLEHCTGDWIIWLDADDILTPESQQKMLHLKNTMLNDGIDAICLPYKYAFASSDSDVCTYDMMRERIFRRSLNPRWEHPIHEYIAANNNWRYTNYRELSIDHRPVEGFGAMKVNRNLEILKKTVANGNKHPRMLYYLGVESLKMGEPDVSISAFSEYFQVAQTQPAWEVYDSHMMLVDHYKSIADYEQAKNHCMCAIKTDPTRAKAFNQMGMILTHEREWAKAISFFTAATALTKGDAFFGSESSEDYTWIPYDYLSLCYGNTGNPAKAIEMAVKGFPFHPNKVQVRQNLHSFVDQL